MPEMSESMKRILATASCAVLLGPVAAAAQTPDPGLRGPWHYLSVACVDTTVYSVIPRLTVPGQRTFTKADFKNAGVEVEFNSYLGMGPAFPKMRAMVTHYELEDGDGLMMEERPGDKVQLCFLNGPTPGPGCNPDKDPRGREYRIFDYKRHASYDGWNEEHGCGGV
jgi:hypothetical protein